MSADVAARGLTFDADTHEYRCQGRRYPSVTQIIAGAGLVDTRWYTDEARVEGTYLHQALALDHEGVLDMATLDEALVPYIESWRTLRAQLGITPWRWELQMVSVRYGFAGTTDLVATCDAGGPAWLIDFKRRAPQPVPARLQLAAYAILARECGDPAISALCMRRAVVTWTDVGKIRLDTLDVGDHRRHEYLFLAALEVYRCKQEAGLLT